MLYISSAWRFHRADSPQTGPCKRRVCLACWWGWLLMAVPATWDHVKP